MNFVRLNEGLYQQAGGWEKFSLGESAPGDSQDLLDLLEEAAPRGLPPEEDDDRPGRRAILIQAVRRGKSPGDTQEALSKAGLPQLYSRNLQDASVLFVLKLCPVLKELLDLKGEEGQDFRLALLDKLQTASRDWLASGAAAPAPGDPEWKQWAAAGRLAAAVKADNCRFQDLADYADAVFDSEPDGSLLTRNVTGQVSRNMAQAVEACQKDLRKLEHGSSQAAADCVLSWWKGFLKDAGPDFTRCQRNALNYLVRALVRTLDPVIDSLAHLSWELHPQNAKETFAMRMRRAHTRLNDHPCNGWTYYELLSRLFTGDRDEDALANALKEGMNNSPKKDDSEETAPKPEPTPDAEAAESNQEPAPDAGAAESNQDPIPVAKAAEFKTALKKVRPRYEIPSDLPLALRPLFLFSTPVTRELYRRDNPNRDALRMARATWASQPLSRTGLAQLLFLFFGPLEKDTLRETGAFLFRVLKGEADLPREAFLLLMLAAESVAFSRWPDRETLAQRLNNPGSSLEDLLFRCGYGPLDPGCLFDGAVIAVLGCGCEPEARPALLRKTAALSAAAIQALRTGDCDDMLCKLADDAEDFEGQSGLEKAFEQLEKGRNAALFIYR